MVMSNMSMVSMMTMISMMSEVTMMAGLSFSICICYSGSLPMVMSMAGLRFSQHQGAAHQNSSDQPNIHGVIK